MGIRPHLRSYFVQRVAVHRKSQLLESEQVSVWSSVTELYPPAPQAQGNKFLKVYKTAAESGPESSGHNRTTALRNSQQWWLRQKSKPGSLLAERRERIMSPPTPSCGEDNDGFQWMVSSSLRVWPLIGPSRSCGWLHTQEWVYGQHKLFCALSN